MKLLLLADHHVGFEITRHLLSDYRDDVAFVVTRSENEIYAIVRDANIPCLVFESADQVFTHINSLDASLDIGLMAWWPELIERALINLPEYGFINTHPSFLPHNRGKHYNFWALVEQAPFGVSLHFVDAGVDSGDLIAQMRVPYGWEDTGATLYSSACKAMVHLFKETYPIIRKLDISRKKQNLDLGSFHLAKELDKASLIDLDQNYKARDLLNLIRARTFPGHPASSFTDAGEEYEVRLEIKRKTP